MVGITFSGRDSSLPGIIDLVGVFIKTLPLRIQLSSNETVLQYIKRTHIDIIKIGANQQIRLAEIKAIMGYKNPQLFDYLVVMQKYRISSGEFANHKKIMNIELYDDKYNSNIDLMVSIRDLPNDYMEIEFNYNTQKYSVTHMDIFYESLISILQSWIQAEDLENLKINLPVFNSKVTGEI